MTLRVYIAFIASVFLLALFILLRPAHAQQLNISVAPTTSASGVNNLLVKALPGNLYQITATNETASAGFLVLLNTVTVPTNGATVTPYLCAKLPASGSVTLDFIPTPPVRFTTGIVAILTSAATCATFTTGTITGTIQAIIQ